MTHIDSKGLPFYAVLAGVAIGFIVCIALTEGPARYTSAPYLRGVKAGQHLGIIDCKIKPQRAVQ